MRIPLTEIILTHAGAETLRRIVGPGDYVFGSEPGADFPLAGPDAAPRHARLAVDLDQWTIEHLGGPHGVFIDDVQLATHEQRRVFPSQMLRLGETAVALRRVREEETAGDSLAPHAEALRAVVPEVLHGRRYAIGPELARGGMGAILRAEDRAIRREVAMKVMLFRGVGEGDLRRFVEEARITGGLEHPGIVPVYELGVDEQDQPFYTMPRVRGMSLETLLAGLARGEEKATLAELLTIFQKACDAVAYAHSRGVLHRDLKPGNIMLGEYGEVLVMDWGLAKRIDSAEHEGASLEPREPPAFDSAATLAGAVLGTPQWMSPEQAAGDAALDARTDIYALGAILYTLLTLTPPIAAGEIDAVLAAVRAGRIEPPRRLGTKRLLHLPGGRVPDSLAAVAMRALARDPAARYASVQELQSEIAAYQGGFATEAERAGLGRQLALLVRRNRTASVAAVLIAVLSAVYFTRLAASERDALAHLARLRATAPTFALHARALVERASAEPAVLAGALANAGHAIELAPGRADFHAQRGDILQTMGRFAEARAAYAEAARLDPRTPFAAENAALCTRLAAAPEDPAALRALYEGLLAQGRRSEAAVVARPLFGDEGAARQALAHWRSQLAAAGVREPGRALRLYRGTRLVADFSRQKQLTSIAFLRHLQLSDLNLYGTRVDDLAPLRGMPLEKLDISETPVRDLEPLRGMALAELHAGNSDVADLSPLRGMPLRRATLGGTRVTDFSPLAGAPLERLALWGVPVRDLSFLRDAPIDDLGVHGCGLTDLEPLRGKALRGLNVSENPVRSLEPLRGMPLRTVNISNTRVTGLGPLAETAVESLDASMLPITSLEPLRGKRLTRLSIRGTKVRDLSPLAGLPLRRLDLRGCEQIADFSPLATLTALEELLLPRKHGDLGFLRALPRLARIAYDADPKDPARPRTTAAEFWRSLGEAP